MYKEFSNINLTDLDNCKIVIESPCNDNPHFHIIRDNINIGIYLYDSKYTDDTNYKLSNIQKEELNKYLSIFNENYCADNWISIITLWELEGNKSRLELNLEYKEPNYLELI